MLHVIALQNLTEDPHDAQPAQEGMVAISELSFAVCGPFPSEFSVSACF